MCVKNSFFSAAEQGCIPKLHPRPFHTLLSVTRVTQPKQIQRAGGAQHLGRIDPTPRPARHVHAPMRVTFFESQSYSMLSYPICNCRHAQILFAAGKGRCFLEFKLTVNLPKLTANAFWQSAGLPTSPRCTPLQSRSARTIDAARVHARLCDALGAES